MASFEVHNTVYVVDSQAVFPVIAHVLHLGSWQHLPALHRGATCNMYYAMGSGCIVSWKALWDQFL